MHIHWWHCYISVHSTSTVHTLKVCTHTHAGTHARTHTNTHTHTHRTLCYHSSRPQTQDISHSCPSSSCPPGTTAEPVNVPGQCCPNHICTGCELVQLLHAVPHCKLHCHMHTPATLIGLCVTHTPATVIGLCITHTPATVNGLCVTHTPATVNGLCWPLTSCILVLCSSQFVHQVIHARMEGSVMRPQTAAPVPLPMQGTLVTRVSLGWLCECTVHPARCPNWTKTYVSGIAFADVEV